MNASSEMNQKAVEIIIKQIEAIPANTPMDYGTLGREVYNLTKREGKAKSLALYFVAQAYGWMDIRDDEEKIAVVNQIVNSAISRVGK